MYTKKNSGRCILITRCRCRVVLRFVPPRFKSLSSLFEFVSSRLSDSSGFLFGFVQVTVFLYGLGSHWGWSSLKRASLEVLLGLGRLHVSSSRAIAGLNGLYNDSRVLINRLSHWNSHDRLRHLVNRGLLNGNNGHDWTVLHNLSSARTHLTSFARLTNTRTLIVRIVMVEERIV